MIVSQDRTIKLKTFSRSHVLEVGAEVERVVIWLLLFQICLLAEELGNHEGRLGWGEGSFYEKGTRGRQAHTRHQ